MTETAHSMDLNEVINAITKAITRHRCDLSCEKRLQADIATILDQTGLEYSREHRLSEEDVPDFLIQGRIVLECKMKRARKMDIYRQIKRYAGHEPVKAIMLASNVPMGLPPEIDGKPVFHVSLSAGWL